MDLRVPLAGEVSLETLFAYSEYMRERFAMALLELTPGDFLAPMGLGWMFENIRDLAAHIVDTEDEWVSGVLTGGPAAAATPADYPDAAALVERWEAVRQRTRKYLESADEAELGRVVVAPFHGSPRFTVRQVLMHLLLHETHHRGQLTAAFRMRGVAPPPSDFYDFVAEQLQ